MRSDQLVLAALLVLAVGCGSDSSSSQVASSGTEVTTATTATTSTTVAPTTTSIELVNGKPHFATPEAAMTYLAAAWNANDLVSLKHVTNPAARDELDAMHAHAVDLKLAHCDEREGLGDYTCTFSHDFPPGVENRDNGEAVFIAGPADTPGWYMTVFESCN